MQTFLSIDLDFWLGLKADRVDRDLNRIVRHCRHRNIPVAAVMNHQQMMPAVSASPARRLLNVDAHDDLIIEPESLGCGSWVSFVEWAPQGTYEWIRRGSLFIGSCDGRIRWRSRNHGTNWNRIRARKLREFPFEELQNDIVEVGLCMSPGYCDFRHRHDEVFREVIRRYWIPYRRGRLRD